MNKVYKYTFPDGMVYIGVTKNTIEERRDCGYSHNARLKDAMRKCGWRSIKVEILHETSTQEEAFALEEKCIEKFESTNPSKGYNVSGGGKSTFKGLRHSEEYKQKMSAFMSARFVSEESKIRMSTAHKKEKKPVISIGQDGSVQKRYESLCEAAKDVGGYCSNIMRACKSGKEYKGFRWSEATKVVMIG